VATKKIVTKPAAKAAAQTKAVAPKKTAKPAPVKNARKVSPPSHSIKTSKPVTPKVSAQAAKAAKPIHKAAAKVSAPTPVKAPPKAPPPVTAKKTPAPESVLDTESETNEVVTPAAAKPAAKSKAARTTLDDLALDIDEKDELLEEEKRDLIKALRDDEDEPLETAFIPTDTSERIILVVDEDGQRRTETVSIVQQSLPNAVIEVADDPEEALEVMEEADFDTYVVNFLMPGFSASPFVKAVANHPDHPLLIGFAADKISDALDQRKGLKIIPLKRLFDLEVSAEAGTKDKAGAED
jgi:hypothetical protein